MFPICFQIGTLRSNDADGNENVIKTMALKSKTTTLQVHHTFLYISFPFSRDCDVKTSSNDDILFLFLSLNMVPWNSALGRFAYNWQSKWVGIIAIRTERKQIHFLGDVIVAVASLDVRNIVRSQRKFTFIAIFSYIIQFLFSVSWLLARALLNVRDILSFIVYFVFVLFKNSYYFLRKSKYYV